MATSKFTALVALLPALLAACGGGGSAAPTPLAPSVAVCAVPVVQIEGDSISTGSGATDPAFTPGRLLGDALGARAHVIVTGIGGTTSLDRLDGTHGYTVFPAGVVGNVYITEFGVNDARQNVDLSMYKGNLRRIASVPGALLMTPTPMDSAIALSNGQSTAEYSQVVRDVGKEMGVPVADVQAYVLSIPNWQVMLPDGVHPSDALYRMIYANAVLPVVKAAVERVACN